MAKSSERFESLRRDIDALARRLDVPSVLIMRSLPRHMRVEASAGRLEDTYPIGAEGRKSVHEDGAHPLYCERVVDRDAPLHVRDSRQETEWAGNEDEVEFGLSNYLGYPVHAPDGTPYGTVCVLDSRPRDYSAEERALLEELRRKVEALLAETVS
ncbi:TPA: GAF domain-containing protein [Pseudomonas aeruginosa]|nr:GAF domain-containing protein [Pseudomonas aeruginosa]